MPYAIPSPTKSDSKPITGTKTYTLSAKGAWNGRIAIAWLAMHILLAILLVSIKWGSTRDYSSIIIFKSSRTHGHYLSISKNFINILYYTTLIYYIASSTKAKYLIDLYSFPLWQMTIIKFMTSLCDIFNQKFWVHLFSSARNCHLANIA